MGKSMTQEFKEGDVVRIFKQPESHYVHLQGKTGVVDEVAEEHIMFNELKLDDGCGGGGWIPKSCLKPVSDPKWTAARDDRKRKFAEKMAAMDERSRKMKQAKLEARLKVGSEFNISANSVKEIVRRYNQAVDEEMSKAGIHDYGY